MKRKNKTTKYILAGLFLSSMMGVTTACDPLGICLLYTSPSPRD